MRPHEPIPSLVISIVDPFLVDPTPNGVPQVQIDLDDERGSIGEPHLLEERLPSRVAVEVAQPMLKFHLA